VQQGLSLTRPAEDIAGRAVTPDLLDVATRGLPALDLAVIFRRHPSAHRNNGSTIGTSRAGRPHALLRQVNTTPRGLTARRRLGGRIFRR
jgi:hypothetical protein